MGRVFDRLGMAVVGAGVLAVYVGAGLGGAYVLAWLATDPPSLWLLGVTLVVGVLVGGLLSYRYGTTRLLAGIDAVALPRWRAPEVHRRVDGLSEAMDIDAPSLMLADLGAPNALSVGGPRENVVVIDRRLLDLLTTDELAGIVAHELAHIQRRDALVKTLAVSVVRALAGALFVLVLPATLVVAGVARASTWFAGRPHRSPDVAAVVGIGVQAFVGAALSLLTLGLLAYSRRREFLADRRAVEVTGDPAALARALAKIHRAATPRWRLRSILTIHGDERSGLRRLLSTHPPVEERIDRLVGGRRHDPARVRDSGR